MNPHPDHLQDIVGLSRSIGRPERDLVILAEGNTSVRTPGDRMLVKASGAHLATAQEDDFVEVDLSLYRELLASDRQGDDAVSSALRTATTWGHKRPSVESLLHAVCFDSPDVQAIAHTHPTPVNALLCSEHADLVAAGSLFPDQIVVLGRQPLLLPYVDPGLPLAREVKRRLAEHVATFGDMPKVIYLINHGMFALGRSTVEVEQVTAMAVKCARVLLGTLATGGGPRFMTDAQAARIDTRPDEKHRREQLAETER